MKLTHPECLGKGSLIWWELPMLNGGKRAVEQGNSSFLASPWVWELERRGAADQLGGSYVVPKIMTTYCSLLGETEPHKKSTSRGSGDGEIQKKTADIYAPRAGGPNAKRKPSPEGLGGYVDLIERRRRGTSYPETDFVSHYWLFCSLTLAARSPIAMLARNCEWDESAAPSALVSDAFHPALPGWAYVWQPGPPALEGWVSSLPGINLTTN